MNRRHFITMLAVAALLNSTISWSDEPPRVIEVTAKRFEYSPSEIHIKANEPTLLKFKTLDRRHGFLVPDLKLEAEIKPGEITELKVNTTKKGRYPFHCNIFCGSGHEGMTGVLIVE